MLFSKSKILKYFQGQYVEVTSRMNVNVSTKAQQGMPAVDTSTPISIQCYLIDADDKCVFIGDDEKTVTTCLPITSISGIDLITKPAPIRGFTAKEGKKPFAYMMEPKSQMTQ